MHTTKIGADEKKILRGAQREGRECHADPFGKLTRGSLALAPFEQPFGIELDRCQLFVRETGHIEVPPTMRSVCDYV